MLWIEHFENALEKEDYYRRSDTCGGAAGYGLHNLGQVNKVSMTLSISYQGIEKGLNPDGTKFNVFEITSSEVLNRTLSKINVPGWR